MTGAVIVISSVLINFVLTVKMTVPKISDFEIFEKLGSGSYATVYKARRKKSNTFYAIKCVQKAKLTTSATHNLISEIQLLKSLIHKYIVGLNDFFWDEKNIYIVLEYCNAGNLSTYIRQRKVLPESTCKYFLGQLAVAMQYMRSNKICHFDLKPQNLLLTESPNVMLKVADFGFAQYCNLGEKNCCLRGSFLYMAPEIVLKRTYDERADLWSIGVILFECLFGNAPYSSKSLDELMNKIQIQKKISIPSNTRISPECEDLLTRLLQHDPSKRISFRDFLEHSFLDLEHFPSERKLEKAVALVTQAVEYDKEQEYAEAYYLYCKALQYFIPLIIEETNATKRQALRSRAISYLNRAEQIKTSFKCIIQDEIASKFRQSLYNLLEPNANFNKLYSLASSSPPIQQALDIGRQGERYSYENKYNSALDSYKSALGILVPLLNKEPKNERRLVLYQQIIEWMQEAESIKSLLSARNLEEGRMSIYNCSLQ